MNLNDIAAERIKSILSKREMLDYRLEQLSE